VGSLPTRMINKHCTFREGIRDDQYAELHYLLDALPAWFVSAGWGAARRERASFGFWWHHYRPLLFFAEDDSSFSIQRLLTLRTADFT